MVLEDNGIIKMDRKKGMKVRKEDVKENKKNLKLVEIEDEKLKSYMEDVDGEVINKNYEIEEGNDKKEDEMVREGEKEK